ncbi:2,3-bisphosphoglycerate-independent phosphoglycerate mutase [Candidatus Woesearchaeota archaeon]|nr:2,3-bisphosphoglycerate-independent phosphoglycerate mutase [Candidatus Woesearchaeota archaeon]
MKKVVLIVLDGYGIRKRQQGNAIAIANTPNMDRLWQDYPHTMLKASGLAVGLPKNVIGNSEAGHENLGAGRIYEQEFLTISKDIKNGKFFEQKFLVKAAKTKGVLHLMGLLSIGGVHSHIDHLFALIELAKKYETQIKVHAFLDGRDMPAKSAKKLIKRLEKKLKGIGEIATISGRFYAMDRDHRWDRTEKVYNLLVTGEGVYHKNALTALKESYAKNESDEFVTPKIVGKKFHGITDNDAVIFFNFRPDRARQLTEAFIMDDFKAFKRKKRPKPYFVTMTEYDADYKVDCVYKRPDIKNIMGLVLEKHKVKQLRISEAEKYADVTYFFDNGREEPFEGSDWVIVPSPKVKTYDQRPEMSAREVTEKLVKAINSKKYGFVLVNLNNCDMVGHTGNIDATVAGVEVVDECVGMIVEACKNNDYVCVITADHGNAEELVDNKGVPHTDHSTNPVPIIIVGYDCRLRSSGVLGDVAPTILKIMGIEIPKEMTGSVLVK